jgi:hypothetical protein
VFPESPGTDGLTSHYLVSQYACRRLAEKLGPEELKHVNNHYLVRLNKAMNGYLLEAYFFASVYMGSVKIFRQGGNDGDFEDWPCMPASVDSVVEHKNPTKAQCRDKTWLRPASSNQASYDAVFLDLQLNMIRFVQITRQQSHGINLRILAELVQNMIKNKVLTSEPNVPTVEVYFLVPRMLGPVNIGPVDGCSALTKYGWSSSESQVSKSIKVGYLDFPMV